MTTTVMMEWDETTTSPSPVGSASGSSMNSHSEAEEESIISPPRTHYAPITSRNTKLQYHHHNHNNNITITTSDKKPWVYYATNSKDNPILNDGFNGLNLNPSPPAPGSVGQDLTVSSTNNTTIPTFFHPPYSSGSSSSSSKSPGTISSSTSTKGSSSQGSSSSTSTGGLVVTKKNKPIPPPLDLSIGASLTNSSSSQSSSSSTGSTPFQLSGSYYSPYYQLGSPRFNQAEKNLPLRKRWHSWSPNFMNCQEDFILPLSADMPNGPRNEQSEAGAKSNSETSGPTEETNVKQPGDSHATTRGQPAPTFTFATPGTKSSSTTNNTLTVSGHGPSGMGNATPQSAGLQTPTPFYTPNEPSPKFMNSPVFSYSTPDTSLYQGPYSPIRSTSLYPPTSPFLNSSLNTPTFMVTNSSPTLPPTTTASDSSPGSSSASSLSPNSALNNVTTLTLCNGLGASPVFNTVPSTMLSPASSQASSTNSCDDSQDKPGSCSSVNNNPCVPAPVWSIFMSGTKVRFESQTGAHPVWLLVDYIPQTNRSEAMNAFLGIKGKYAPHGLQVKTYVVASSNRERVQLTLCPVDINHPSIEVDCEPGHPFMVEKKGWCAVKPEAFFDAYGCHCQILEGGDICCYTSLTYGLKSSPQPPPIKEEPHETFSHVQNSNSVPLFLGINHTTLANNLRNSQSFPANISRTILHPQNILEDIKPNLEDLKSNFMHEAKTNFGEMKPLTFAEDIKPFQFPMPMPISVIPPTHHHIHHHSHPNPGVFTERSQEYSKMEVETSGYSSKKLQPPPVPRKSKVKKPKDPSTNSDGTQAEPKGRRPMNAFLLFAKDKRPELIQQFPGKDNRSISVLLGEAWKSLEPQDKEVYAKCAKDRADEQKKIHPDCWKRKRSQSTTL